MINSWQDSYIIGLEYVQFTDTIARYKRHCGIKLGKKQGKDYKKESIYLIVSYREETLSSLERENTKWHI